MRLKTMILAFATGLCLTACEDEIEPYMDLSQGELSVTEEGGSYSIEVKSNVEYVVNNECEWARIVNTTNNGDAITFDISVRPNSDKESRKGRIKFIGPGVTPKALSITQAGVVPTGVSITSIAVESPETSASFSVLGEKEWTATSSDPDYVLSQTSGLGEAEIKVTFPANTGTSDKTVTISVVVGSQNYSVVITHKGNRLSGIIADWPIDQMKAQIEQEWGTRELPATVGFAEPSITPLTGKGSIRYYACDRTGLPKASGYLCYVQTGGHGDAIFKATIKGDYWLVTAGLDSDVKIPAGRKINFEYTASITKNCSAHWLVEYLDGTEWKPALPTSTAKVSASAGISGTAMDYTEDVTYNMTFSGAAVYTLVEGSFTLANEMENLQLRISPVSNVCLDGTYIDQITTNGSSRFSAQHPHVDGKAVKEYNQHVKFEFAD